jgi:surfeit locus 1 family protein
MPLRISFRPRVASTLLALTGVVSTAWLGDWQLNRAAHKAELQQRFDLAMRQPPIRISADELRTGDIIFFRVEADGEFMPERTILLDNRVRNGVVGYEVVTPLKLAGGTRHLLVNRGWVKAPPTRDQLPAIDTPHGEVKVEGTALPPPGRVFALSAAPESGSVWQHLSLERVRDQFKLDPQPLVLQQDNDTGDGLLRNWPRPDAGVGMHRAYAMQWFVMSGVILLLYVVLNVRKQTGPLGPA